MKVKEGQVDDSGDRNTISLAFWHPSAKEGKIWGLFEGEKYLLEGHSINSKIAIRQGKLVSIQAREFLVEQFFVNCPRHLCLALACRQRFHYEKDPVLGIVDQIRLPPSVSGPVEHLLWDGGEGLWHVSCQRSYLFVTLGSGTSNPK